MAEKETKKEEKITVKYVGSDEITFVPGFLDGRGLFKKNGQHTFNDPEEMKAAKKLIKTNDNFREVK